MSSTYHRSCTRSGPIITAAEALAVIRFAQSAPERPETIAFLLDDRQFATGTILSVAGTELPGAVLDVAEAICEAARQARADGRHDVESLVIASIRPGRPLEVDDATLWRRLSDLVDDHGLVLREWFVIGGGRVGCPRDLCFEPDRWPW